MKILRCIPPILLTILLFAYCLLPNLSHCGRAPIDHKAVNNLKDIVNVWRTEAAENGGLLIASFVHFREQVPLRLSPISQNAEMRKRYRFGHWIENDFRGHSLVLLIYSLIMAALVRGKFCTWMAWSAGLALLGLFASGFGHQFAEWRVPRNTDYLLDYKLVAGWDWSMEKPEIPEIVAYAVTSQWSTRRAVATTDGVGWYPEEDFQRMTMEQGIVVEE